MPSPGTFVIYYVHESWDNNHRAVDSPALVLEELADGVLRLQVFQWGVAPFQIEVGEFPEDLPIDVTGRPVAGGNYWREGDAPDFESAYSKAQESAADSAREREYEAEAERMRVRQQQELSDAKNPEAAKAIEARHAKEWEDLDAKFDAPAQPSAEPPRPDPTAVDKNPPPVARVGDSAPKIL